MQQRHGDVYLNFVSFTSLNKRKTKKKAKKKMEKYFCSRQEQSSEKKFVQDTETRPNWKWIIFGSLSIVVFIFIKQRE